MLNDYLINVNCNNLPSKYRSVTHRTVAKAAIEEDVEQAKGSAPGALQLTHPEHTASAAVLTLHSRGIRKTCIVSWFFH